MDRQNAKVAYTSYTENSKLVMQNQCKQSHYEVHFRSEVITKSHFHRQLFQFPFKINGSSE